MSEAKVGRRRGHGEDAVHLDAARGWYVGAASLGLGPDGRRVRRKVSGKTKQEVRDNLKALHQELDAGVRSSSMRTRRCPSPCCGAASSAPGRWLTIGQRISVLSYKQQ